ncbi:MAG: hypothetical protein V5A61_09780 [Haloarculaceae archaeon]
MVSPHAVDTGVLASPPVFLWAALTKPSVLTIDEFLPGVVAVVLAVPGGRSGLVHGLLAGGLCTLLSCALLGEWALSLPDTSSQDSASRWACWACSDSSRSWRLVFGFVPRERPAGTTGSEISYNIVGS